MGFPLELGTGAGVKKTRMMGLPGRQRSLTISSAVWIECTNVVAIPPDQLKQTTVATRRHETRYMQIRCNSCMYSHTFFFPIAVRLWNRVPSDTCYLVPDSFKLELSKINLIWSCTKFLSHRTARFYFLILAQHTIPQHMTSTHSAILL